ncbi:MAG: hypothetical protein HY735_21100 [Verrucomicrobia bacterium]|nr:hypothetical protein [Verrucomicrobiota bacterium]
MFERLGEFAGALFMLGFGMAAYFKPYHMAGVDGPPEAIQKRIRFMKRCGILLIICGGALSVFAFYDFFVWLAWLIRQKTR